MNLTQKSLVLGALLLIACLASPAGAATTEESLKKSFPNIKAESIRPTAIPGLYEVVSGGRIVYYAPGPEQLIYGPLISREGKNLTEERIGEIVAKGVKTLPLDKAIKIGAGSHQVIEITDPDCPYCRKASAYLADKKDTTRYVFFFPLAMHPNADAKVRQILCAEDRAKAYEEAMAGKLDDMKFKPCTSPAADELAKAHKEMLTRIGVNSTPMFMIDSEIVWGANIPRMEQLLGVKK
jgi:thiol:disulfide interchange protein DsbC